MMRMAISPRLAASSVCILVVCSKGSFMIYRIPVIVSVIYSFCALAAAAQSLTPLEQKLSGSIGSALKESGAPSVSVAVVENGKLSYARTFGKANIEADHDAGVHTRYAVGSVSKQFTVEAILLAEERHKLSLDDKVSKYFPDLTRTNEITLRELLSHTSGYEDYAPQDYIITEWDETDDASGDPRPMGQKAAEFRSPNALAVQRYQLCDRRRNFRKGLRSEATDVSECQDF